jgi:hypothetical protein
VRLDPKIDLWKLKASRLDLEIESKFSQFFELRGDLGVIPCGPIRELIVGKSVG